MTVLHSGSNNKYSSNWSRVFAKGGKGKATSASGGKKAGARKSAKSKRK